MKASKCYIGLLLVVVFFFAAFSCDCLILNIDMYTRSTEEDLKNCREEVVKAVHAIVKEQVSMVVPPCCM
jgi:hypothetical protein